MSDSSNPADASASHGEPGAWNRNEIEAAIAGLDRATRKFTSRVDALSHAPATAPGSAYPAPAPPLPAPTPPASRQLPPVPAPPPGSPSASRPEPAAPPLYPRPERPTFDQQMREAEDAAREYLDRAKRRADTLVQTMIAAVEREAAKIRREAEDGIRERWNSVELEAGRYLGDAQLLADNLVTERRTVLDDLSGGIEQRARSLTTGLEDAERIQEQFERFVRGLSAASNRIAEEAAGAGGPDVAKLEGRHGGLRGDDALAA